MSACLRIDDVLASFESLTNPHVCAVLCLCLSTAAECGLDPIMWRTLQAFATRHVKIIILVVLCLQNSIHSLVMGYSNCVLKEKYSKKV